MSDAWNRWLADADAALVSDSTDDDTVDALLAAGLALDDQEVRPAEVNQVHAARVLACLQARHIALAVEIADLARRRTALARAKTATTGYLNAPDIVPIR